MKGWIISAKIANAGIVSQRLRFYRGENGRIVTSARDAKIFSSREEAQWIVPSFHAALRSSTSDFKDMKYEVECTYESVHEAFTKQSNVINNRAQLQMNALQKIVGK